MSLRDLVQKQDDRFNREIPKPTFPHAINHLRRAVQESDRRRLVSPTIEAMRVVVEACSGPEESSKDFAAQPEHQ